MCVYVVMDEWRYKLETATQNGGGGGGGGGTSKKYQTREQASIAEQLRDGRADETRAAQFLTNTQLKPTAAMASRIMYPTP